MQNCLIFWGTLRQWIIKSIWVFIFLLWLCRFTGCTWKPLNPVSLSWGSLGTRWVGGDMWNTSVNLVTVDVLKGMSTWSRYGWEHSDTCPGYFVKLNTIYFLVCKTFIFFWLAVTLNEELLFMFFRKKEIEQRRRRRRNKKKRRRNENHSDSPLWNCKSIWSSVKCLLLQGKRGGMIVIFTFT